MLDNILLSLFIKLSEIHLIIACFIAGDLTDAKAEDNLKSEQYLDEWVSYKSLIDYCKKQITAEWLDVAGNHGMLTV